MTSVSPIRTATAALTSSPTKERAQTAFIGFGAQCSIERSEGATEGQSYTRMTSNNDPFFPSMGDKNIIRNDSKLEQRIWAKCDAANSKFEHACLTFTQDNKKVLRVLSAGEDLSPKAREEWSTAYEKRATELDSAIRHIFRSLLTVEIPEAVKDVHPDKDIEVQYLPPGSQEFGDVYVPSQLSDDDIYMVRDSRGGPEHYTHSYRLQLHDGPEDGLTDDESSVEDSD